MEPAQASGGEEEEDPPEELLCSISVRAHLPSPPLPTRAPARAPAPAPSRPVRVRRQATRHRHRAPRAAAQRVLFTDPVIDPEGNSYERSFIEQWLTTRDTSPITRARLSVADLRPNRALRTACESWRASAEEARRRRLLAGAPPPAAEEEYDVDARGNRVRRRRPSPGRRRAGGERDRQRAGRGVDGVRELRPRRRRLARVDALDEGGE